MIHNHSVDHTHHDVIETLHSMPYVVAVFISVLLVPIVVISNGVIVVTTFLLPALHRPTDHIVTTLAALDFFIGVMTIPIFILNNIPETMHIFRKDGVACRFYWIITDFTEYGSLSILLFLCLERFICINWPFFYRERVSGRRIHGVLLLIIVLETIQSLFIYIVLYDFDETEIHLMERCNHYNLPEMVYKYYIPGKLGFCVLMSVLMTCQITYVTINTLVKIRKQTMISKKSSFSVSPRRHSKLVLILMVMFVPMWAPSIVVNRIHTDYFATNPMHASQIDLVAMLLRISNSAVNAFAYAFTKKTYRVAYFHLLTTPPWQWCELAAAVRHAVAFSFMGRAQMPMGSLVIRDIRRSVRNKTDRASSINRRTTQASSRRASSASSSAVILFKDSHHTSSLNS